MKMTVYISSVYTNVIFILQKLSSSLFLSLASLFLFFMIEFVFNHGTFVNYKTQYT